MSKRYIVGAVVAALIVVGVIVGISVAGGGGDGGEVTGIEGAAEVRELVEGIPQEGRVLGDPDAPVTVVEYGDIACPACKTAAETTIPELIGEYVRDGRVKLEIVPIDALRTVSGERGALGVIAAEEQDAAWSLTELLYKNQGDERSEWLTEDLLEEAVAALGLDVADWRAAYDGDGVVSRFDELEQRAIAAEVRVTPTFVVEGPRGERTLEGAANIGAFREAIDEVGPET